MFRRMDGFDALDEREACAGRRAGSSPVPFVCACFVVAFLIAPCCLVWGFLFDAHSADRRAACSQVTASTADGSRSITVNALSFGVYDLTFDTGRYEVAVTQRDASGDVVTDTTTYLGALEGCVAVANDEYGEVFMYDTEEISDPSEVVSDWGSDFTGTKPPYSWPAFRIYWKDMESS